uniref:Uncharacterized protein n=1 Tax=Fusarium oxysporum (strain Fo5176) TaxID=660025 RepID=A0A0C4DIN2_FUSOF
MSRCLDRDKGTWTLKSALARAETSAYRRSLLVGRPLQLAGRWAEPVPVAGSGAQASPKVFYSIFILILAIKPIETSLFFDVPPFAHHAPGPQDETPVLAQSEQLAISPIAAQTNEQGKQGLRNLALTIDCLFSHSNVI